MFAIRYALRGLLRTPGFAAVTVLTLALGIGGTSVIFTIFNSILLKPLAFREPDRLYVIQESVKSLAAIAPELPVNAMHFGEWKRNNRTFEDLGMIGSLSFNLTSDGDPLRITGLRISASLLPMIGLNPLIGRVFTETEDKAGREQVVLISEGLWTSRFHRDPSVLGRKILLDDLPYEVIGVLPSQPKIPNGSQVVSLPGSSLDPQIVRPFAVRDSELSPAGDYNWGCIGRLKPGVTAEQAKADLDAIESSIGQNTGNGSGLQATITPLRDQMTGSTRQSLVLLLSAVGAVLLIVCVNIASLMLIRVNARQREIAVRAALGASRVQLAGQVMTESLVLATIGGLLGAAMGYALLGVVLRAAPTTLPRIGEIRMDPAAFGFTLLLSIATGVLFALLPARRFASTDPGEVIKAGVRSGTEGRQGVRSRDLLVSLEVALSTVTLVAAGLLLHSFVRLMNVDKGFQVDRAMTASIRFSSTRYPAIAKRSAFLEELLSKVGAIPGVTAAGVSNMLPLTGEGSNNGVVLEGQSDDTPHKPVADYRCVSPDYFRAMGVPLLDGRIFDTHDRQRNLVLVSARTAQKLWPDQGAIGKRFHLGSVQNPLLEVIGVTGDIHGVSLQKDPNLTVYLPYWSRDRMDMALVVRASVDPLTIAPQIREQIHQLDSQMALPQFITMQQVVDRSVAARRFQMNLVLIFGGVALVLSALGVYGVVSYSVNQRIKEMGIRMVLGARGRDVIGLVLSRGMLPVAGGLAVGIILAAAASRLLSGLLFGVHAADPATFSLVVLVVGLSTAIGCLLPARRATRVDPAVALRYE